MAERRRFRVPAITRPVDLADYAPEYRDAESGESPVVQMWVNPPRARLAVWTELRGEHAAVLEDMRGTGDAVAIRDRLQDISARMNAWLAEMWSQGADPETHWTADEVQELSEVLFDTDPAAWRWLIEHCLGLVHNYRKTNRKN